MNSSIQWPWSKVIFVTAKEPYRLFVRLDDGRELLLDIRPLVERHQSLWRLRHAQYFQKVQIDEIGAICWPEGEDIAPEAIESYILKNESL